MPAAVAHPAAGETVVCPGFAEACLSLEQTGADELIFTGDLYQPEQRQRSFEIVAGLR